MARYTGPMTKKSRRLGTDLVGNDKAFERRPYPPGVHGRGRTKDSEYSLQLKVTPARPVTRCCRSSSRVSTMSCTAPGSRLLAARPVSSWCMATSWSTVRR